MTGTFLTAEWRNLVMFNYEVDPDVLRPVVPRGTELDSWSDRTFISLVGFLFARTRVMGVSIPFHQTFEEVNLRFYVRRVVNGEVRRAVTFIKEFVPRISVAATARIVYNEPYEAVPMFHKFGAINETGMPASVAYSWRVGGRSIEMSVEPVGAGSPVETGSEQEFITEHYWGYTSQRDGSTIEYRVDHPKWRVWSVSNARVTGDLTQAYGAPFAPILSAHPSSVFLADGSLVSVARPSRLPASAE
jgi:uncharacterized protein